MGDARYGAKCHVCTHLLGPIHDVDAVWPVHAVLGCERCQFCQDAAFSEFLDSHLTLDMFAPEVRAAVVALREHRPHPLIDQLRAELHEIEASGE